MKHFYNSCPKGNTKPEHRPFSHS